MFSEIWNYLILPSFISIGTFGIYYTVFPENGNYIMTNMAWYGVKLYSKAMIFYEDNANTEDLEENDDFKDVDEEESTLSYYTDDFIKVHLGNNHTDIPKDWWENHQDDFDILVLKKNNMYKTFSSYNELKNSNDDWEKMDSPFVQVELIVGEETLDIHEILNNFYLKNNKILDKTFVRWFLKKWFNIENETYEIKIFDNDVNLVCLKSNEYIYLNNTSYEVRNENETYDTEDNEESEESEESEKYEGATSE